MKIHGLESINDLIHVKDSDFTGVKKTIIERAGWFFRPGVARAIKSHFKAKKA